MKNINRFFISLILLSYSVFAQSDILVLVHGWRASADTWLHNGVIHSLETKGWVNQGVIFTANDGHIQLLATHKKLSSKNSFSVNLPAEAPLQIQASHLIAYLQYLHQLYPDENIHLAGHSAGGVVSRLALLGTTDLPIKSLISIASPNLGTERAIQGLDIVNDQPFFCPGPGIEFLKNVVGGNDYQYLKHSQGAMVDLTPAVPGSLIGWLNQQPHPDISYHSIIRQWANSSGDELVPAFSQDLNQVAALRGKSAIYLTPARHSLNPADGILIADILVSINK